MYLQHAGRQAQDRVAAGWVVVVFQPEGARCPASARPSPLLCARGVCLGSLDATHASADSPEPAVVFICQVKDALRGKAGDEKVVQELAEHKEVIKAAELKAAEVSQGRLRWLAE